MARVAAITIGGMMWTFGLILAGSSTDPKLPEIYQHLACMAGAVVFILGCVWLMFFGGREKP